MTKKIYVVDAVVKKTGVGKYGPWTLVNVTDQDQIKYSTFEPEWLNRKGSEHEIEYEEKTDTKDGKTYTNRNILKKSAVQPDAKILRYIEDLYSKIKLLEARITTLEQQKVVNNVEDEAFNEPELPPLPY